MNGALPSESNTVITFYSYKGGTGRSMALANYACYLALRLQLSGKRILVVDWDLEAPGLQSYFPKAEAFPRGEGPGGVIDLFANLKSQFESNGSIYPAIQGPEGLSAFERSVSLDDYVIGGVFQASATVDMIRAGRFGPEFTESVNTFPWIEFFKCYPAVFSRLRELISTRYEYCLIDSRTGLTDTSGICTMLMPEKLVAVFTPNLQSLNGIVHLLQESLAYRAASSDFRPLSIFPLPSRIENVQRLQEQWRERYQAAFEDLFCGIADRDKPDLTQYFNEVLLPHKSDYAFGESIAIIEEKFSESGSLRKAYEAFFGVLTDSEVAWDVRCPFEATLPKAVFRRPVPDILKPPKTNRYIFISSAREDSVAAQRIAGHLQEAGYECFLQVQSLPRSGTFPREIEEALKRATQFIAVISPDYVGKEYYLHELYEEWRRDPTNRNNSTILAKVRDCSAPDIGGPFVYINLVYLSDQGARAAIVEAVEGKWHGSPFARKLSVSKLPTADPTLIGREDELARMEEAWANPRTNLMQIIAPGGTGKTALVTKWYKRHLDEATVFGWSFHSQGSNVNRNASSDPFFAEVMRFLDIKVDASASIYRKAELVVDRLREERVLLILDGMEPLQESTGALKDSALKVLLEELTARNLGLALCTTRVRLTDVRDEPPGALSIELDNLEPIDGAKYLRHLNVDGTDEELEQASRDYGNHALALTLLGTYVTDFLGRDIRRRIEIPNLFDPDTRFGEHARKVMQGYEKMFAGKPEASILRALGYFDGPAEAEALKLVLPEMTPLKYRAALNRLADARLILDKDPRNPIDCDSLAREHFGANVRREDRKAFEKGHLRLYEYYSKKAPHRPDTLEEMAPLFHAVRHGCLAGRHQEVRDKVYYLRILRGAEFYLDKKLGAFATDLSLLAYFFETPWTRPSNALSASDQSWVVSEAGFVMRALGRLADAVEPTRLSAEAAVAHRDWANSATRYANLSELQLVLGRIGDAIESARGSVQFADRTGDVFQRLDRRIVLADALHRANQVSEASRLFQEAEGIQAARQPDHPILYSVQGYRYCDLLLSLGRTDEALRRANQALTWGAEEGWLLSVGLDHLTLGRAYPPGSLQSAGHLSQAVDFLRRAGQLDDLPLALLARATDSDLVEVFRIATRSGMRLHLADYHLAMARRHLSKDHFDRAAELIAATGYHRRDSELDELRQLTLR